MAALHIPSYITYLNPTNQALILCHVHPVTFKVSRSFGIRGTSLLHRRLKAVQGYTLTKLE